MSEEICDVIDKLAEKIGIAVDWGNENIAPYIQDLVERYSKYEISNCAIWCAVLFILTVCCVVGIVRSCRSIKRRELCCKGASDAEDDEYINILIIVFSILGLPLFGIAFCCCLDMLMQWVFIPDISFIKAITTIMK